MNPAARFVALRHRNFRLLWWGQLISFSGSIMLQIASVLGPSVAGVVIASLGVGWVYAINALSFVFVIAALLRMRDIPRAGGGAKSDISLKAAWEGLRFVFSSPMIRSTMLLDFFATFFSSATALLPIFAQDILRVGAWGYGWLYAAPSIGALLASGIMVQAKDCLESRWGHLICAVTGYGLAKAVFGWAVQFWQTIISLSTI